MNNQHLQCNQLENQLCHNLYVISNKIIRTYRPMLDKLDLTYSQYVVLMGLWEKDKLSISELHQLTQVDIGCLSLMLKKMNVKGLVELIARQDDKRVKLVCLTEKGENLEPIIREEKSKLNYHNPLNDDEHQTLLMLLKKLK